ncbi:ESX-1 secretion-associated regulator EspR [Mycobacteroides abscessus subsp. abscessus]|nr:ESX-1 secretion-associated regulator EspR [Mycobacteroides abscessus subsp. abscessus]SHV24672.1 ESX-1 secretion-associated regulator EspR [Mycobacteroides abscessus subsp. abscessus]SIA26700.1 ESX-1 secretion-associated regulator EspR [Mycobacteroides abscessus subsp. abscessus]SIH48935.1 ESX-1 secretion-associated regulator EspR [Mycobacteroides abscessus subsp. abscessus]SLJ08268.1 ESX-1 secretion-associated regulator EspR [Mycobacteroides abscessus subsp. abscessus]
MKPSYFTDSSNDSKNSERLKLLAAMRNSGVEGLSLRATGLSDATIARVTTILDSARELEGLDPISEPTDERPGQ